MRLISGNKQKSETQQLVEMFLERRNERSFRKLYRRCTPVIYLLALRMLSGNETDAEEIMQEVWMRAIEGLPRFRWQSTFETWLYSITIRCCQEALRKRNKQDVAENTELMSDPSPFEKFEAMDLETAIQRLPDGYRQVLILHDIKGYTHKEIAHLLDIDPGTSKSQLFNARRKIRDFFAKNKII